MHRQLRADVVLEALDPDAGRGASDEICGGSQARTGEIMKLIEGYSGVELSVEQAIPTIAAATTQPTLRSIKW